MCTAPALKPIMRLPRDVAREDASAYHVTDSCR